MNNDWQKTNPFFQQAIKAAEAATLLDEWVLWRLPRNYEQNDEHDYSKTWEKHFNDIRNEIFKMIDDLELEMYRCSEVGPDWPWGELRETVMKIASKKARK